MKLIIVACALVAIAVAAPSENPNAPTQIVRSGNEKKPDGSYEFFYETNDGVVKQESSEVVEVPNEEGKIVKILKVRGYYTFPDAKGELHTINYSGDENGYHAEGADIPQAPVARRR